MGVEQNGQLGFSFTCPDKDVERVTDSLVNLQLKEYTVSSDGFQDPVITGRCAQGQDRAVAGAILKVGQLRLQEGDVKLLRYTKVTFEDLSKRELLKGGGIRTVVHQIAIRSLIQTIEED